MNEFWPQAETSDMKLAATKSVLIAVRVHPFPSRTRQLSSLAPKILGWRRPGKIGSADTKGSGLDRIRPHQYSSLAQLVEHAAVNRRVVGSSPTGGAILTHMPSLFGGGICESEICDRRGPLAQLVRAAGS